MSSRPAWSTDRVPEQPGSHSETISKQNMFYPERGDIRLSAGLPLLTFDLPFFNNLFLFYCISVLSACLPACVRVSNLEVTDSCELPYGCWELNSGPLEVSSLNL